MSRDDPQLPDIAVPGAVRIGAGGTDYGGDDVLAAARAAFADAHALLLPEALEPGFLATLLEICGGSDQVEDLHGKVGWRTMEAQDRAGRALRFAIERPDFLRWIEAASGCGPLRTVSGVVAEMAAGSDQALDWHDDCNVAGRKLAIIIHLSDAAYEGGLFELEEKAGRKLARLERPAPGTVLLFKVDPALRHRVSGVTGGGPRRVFAGWLNG